MSLNSLIYERARIIRHRMRERFATAKARLERLERSRRVRALGMEPLEGRTMLAAQTIIQPVAYAMPNGNTGGYTYWDDTYNGSGNRQQDDETE